MKLALRTILLLIVCWSQTMAWSQSDTYPSKPIRIIVPLGGGSGVDSFARKFAEILAENAHMPVIVENKPGADAAIGIREMLNAPADGYTLVAMTGGMLYMTPFLIKDLAYDPRDIQPLVGLAVSDAVLIVNDQSRFKNLSELLAEGRKKEGAPFFGSYSQTFRGARLLLEKLTGTRFTEVPYKGAAQLVSDLIGGTFDAAFMDAGSAIPLIKAGKIRALVITGAKRSDALPGVPTMIESGYPTFNVAAWTGIGLSRKTPKAVLEKLESLAMPAANRADITRFYADRLSYPMQMNAAQLGDFVDKETSVYRELLK